MGRRLFVGGLAWAADENDLREHFEQCGTVTYAKVVEDRETGRSRGFGFVEFETNDEAEDALAELNGTELCGRKIRVDKATERSGGNRSGGGGQGRGGNKYSSDRSGGQGRGGYGGGGYR